MSCKLTLHSVHNFTPLQMFKLIFTVFDSVPNSFQLLQCSSNTSRQQLDLFFDRLMHWKQFHYLVIGVNYLPNELQEVCIILMVTENALILCCLNFRCLYKSCKCLYRNVQIQMILSKRVMSATLTSLSIPSLCWDRCHGSLFMNIEWVQVSCANTVSYLFLCRTLQDSIATSL